MVPSDEFVKIYELCRAKNIWVVTDECYSHFVYGDEKPWSLASVSGSKPNIIVIGSLSKTFAMTGWRIGYALAPEPLISAMIKVQSQSTSNPTSSRSTRRSKPLTGAPMDTVRRHARGICASAQPDRLRTARDSRRDVCRAGRRVLRVPEFLGASGNGIADSHPACANNCSSGSTLSPCPGDAFGTPGHIRILIRTSIERIEEGLRRLEKFCAMWKRPGEFGFVAVRRRVPA